MNPILFHLFAVGLLLVAGRAQAQVVTTTADTGAGSLRSVVAGAASGATVTFAAGLSGQAIVLTNGAILLDKNITIDASALANGILITNTMSLSSILRVFTNVTVNLKGLSLSGGTTEPDLVFSGRGGAILNHGTLTLTGCTLEQNTAVMGGAIYNHLGTLNLNRCTFRGNSMLVDHPGYGGAVYNEGGTLTISQCTLTGNSVNSYDSEGGKGGAVYNLGGSLTVNQSTIVSNSATKGPVVHGNQSPPGYGGGVFNDSGSFTLFNSIVAGNSADTNADIYGVYTTKGTNLIGGDPLLLPLGNYGGPTQTMPPRTNSPALNAASDFTDQTIIGSTNFIPTTLLFPNDQRGRPRLFGAHVDIGAVELQSPRIVTTNADAGSGSLRQAVSDVDPAETTITFAPGLSGQSIQLNQTLSLTNDCTIDAAALPGGIQLLGSYRVLEVAANTTAELRSLTLRNGFDAAAGAGVFNQGNLTLDRCTIADNGGSGEVQTTTGGGLYNAGQLTLNQCTISGNRALYGAGLYNHASGTIEVNQCTIAGNESSSASGGIFSYGNVTLFNSIAAGNQGGGVYDPNLASVTLSTTGTNLIGGDPVLAALANYGGPTPTMPPLPGSPALDAGADSATNNFTTDQRGGWRRSGAGVDIGAVEVVAASGLPAVLTTPTQLANGARQLSFTNLVAAGFTVYASANVAAPINTWSNLGPAVETPLGSGQYQFTDLTATNNPQRFYRVSSP